MHLINVDTLRLETSVGDCIPPYAILSHTWGANQQEISFEDIQKGNIEKLGNGTKKLKGCFKQAKEDHLEYAWIDTCCIDKKSPNELEEAINSMFEWYRKASVCYAYLSDVPSGHSHLDRGSKFFSSRWFQRGWTLQELLAPKQLRFYDQEWTFVGTKASISGAIEAITGISRQFLHGWVDFRQVSVAQRMSWVANRQTSRREDSAYCLLGVFDVTMPMIYGEGDRALGRQQQEIMKNTGDHSILAWGLDILDLTSRISADVISTGILAATPSDFANCRRIVQRTSDAMLDGTFDISGGRLRVHLSLYTTSAGGMYGLLHCGPEHRADQIVGIPVQRVASDGSPDEYFRPQGHHSILLTRPVTSNISTRLMCIRMERRGGAHEAVSKRLWLYLDGYREVNLKLEEFNPTVCWENERIVVYEAGESDTYLMRRYLARFRTHGNESRDVIVVLEFEMHRSQPQARCHVMTSSRDTPLEHLSENLMRMRPEALEKYVARVGTDHMKVTLEQAHVAQEPMLIVKLVRASSSLEVSVDANLELGQMNLMLEYIKILQDDSQAQLETEQRVQKKNKETSTMDKMRERLAMIEESLRKLGEEECELIKEVEKKAVLVEQLTKGLKEAGGQQAEWSKRKSELHRHLDETNRDPWGWLGTHINALLNTSQMMDSSKESGDSDSDHPQRPMGGGIQFNVGNQTPLLWAAMSGQEVIVKLLLEREADKEAKDSDGRTPISLAAAKGHEAIVRLLAEEGADIETKDNDGRTRISLAAYNGHEAVVRPLIEKGASIKTTYDNGYTLLSLAACNGHQAAVKLLIANGADINRPFNTVRTPLSLAACNGHGAVVRLLPEEGADINTKLATWRTTSHLSAPGTVQSSGVRTWTTAISLAVCKGHAAVVRLLVEKGADIQVQDYRGCMLVSEAAYNGHEAVVRLLIEKGADMKTRDKDGYTPLHQAALNGHEAVVRLLVEKGADIETKTKFSHTPLHLAVNSRQEAVVRLLVEKGADIDKRDIYGYTPVSRAASNGHEA